MDAIASVIFKFLQRTGAPPVFSGPAMMMLAERPPMPAVTFPDASFASARRDKHGRLMPQAIAHRGYKAKHPENTMAAFRAAVEGGVHALETDVHLTKDNVVTISHDGSLQRCFGVNKKVIECEWDFIKTLRTVEEPSQPMPSLEDVLRYMCEPGVEHVWLMLDIKLDNNADDIMRLMAETVARVPPAQGTKWRNRIVLGCWAAKFFPLCDKYFPGFPVCNIGFSVPYSQQFLSTPNISMSMLIASLIGPLGRYFIRKAKARKQRLYSWTVNSEKTMDWCIRHEFDGVISDDPVKFLSVCDNFQEHNKPGWPMDLLFTLTRINIFAFIFSVLFWQRHGFGLNKQEQHKKKL